MLKEIWDSLSGPAKMILGLSVAEGLLNTTSTKEQANKNSNNPKTDPRKENLRNSIFYEDPMTAFHNLTLENQQKVLGWAKQYNLTIEEVIRKVIDR